ncbi:DUF3243 domain-containing protein [Paenibacillus ginsengarvi]|uniref:DUF3243 domain-containing protein n=1 Tax=Paenibacillus ginsengarvi TaxID=400777 RepID=A0A3B0CTL2_9BACL|nr:DUF3243 domain-containing protein [Paenibacillus ginsengarvi]RKN86457.1 DUF3243 domain-containing protein [Paenibacillus ginsengarvi]
MATVLKSFERWKEFLSERVEQAHKAGMSEETISKIAAQVGEFLANKIDPENKEERILKELWDVADDEDKKVLARCMVKLVSQS